MKVQQRILAGVLTLALSAPGLVWAQSSTAAAPAQPPTAQPNSEADTGALGTVVVTARRRAENVQSVPIAISAFSPQTLKQQQFHSTYDLQTLVPGLQVTQSGGGLNTVIRLRGLSRLSIGDAFQGAVAVYFADVPMTPEAQLTPSYDISGIQVLKGPQGTLFGRNTTGGAVLINPAEPNFRPGGYIQLEGGNYNYVTAEGALNIPIVDDKLSVRVAGQIRRRNGYTKNYGLGPDTDDLHDEGARVSVLFKPTPRISNLTIFDYSQDGGAGQSAGAQLIPLTFPTGLIYTGGPGGLAFLPVLFNCPQMLLTCSVAANLAFQQAHNGGHSVIENVAPSTFRQVFGITNRTTVDIGGGFTFKNIFGFRQDIVRTVSSSLPGGYDSPFSPGPYDLPLNTAYQDISSRQFTEEPQIQGDLFDHRVHLTVGAFFLSQTPYSFDALRADAAGGTNPWGYTYFTTSSKAVYGQVDVKLDQLVHGLSITAGIRETWDSLSVCSAKTASAPAASLTAAQCPTYAGGGGFPASTTIPSSSSAPTWTVSLNYQPTPDILLYFTNRRGYRAGGPATVKFADAFTTQNPDPITGLCGGGVPVCANLVPFQTFQPEYITDFEIGAKLTWRAGSWSGLFDIDGYESFYSNIQELVAYQTLSALDPNGTPPFGSIFVNLGKQTLRGVEMTAVVSPFQDLQLSANVSYFNSGKATLSGPALPPGGTFLGDLTGQSNWTWNIGGRYVFPFHPGNTDFALNINWYHAPQNWSLPPVFLPPYDLVDLRLSATNIAGSGVDAAFFIHNLTNAFYYTQAAFSSPAFGPTSAFVGEPRMYGVQLSYKFGQ